MKKPIFRRLVAFILDLLIVSIISSALSNISFLNPQYEKYNETYDSYIEYIETKTKNNELQDIYNSSEYKDYMYQINYYGKNIKIITLVVSILYFVVFQYFTKGYTGGKKLFHIKVKSNKKELKFNQILLRSIFANNLLTSLLSILLISFLDKSLYINSELFIEIINLGIIFVCFGMMLYRKDGKGLHDLIAGTNVVDDRN